MRVVSLVPSVTETLAAWDLDPAACTRFCERPDLVHVGGTKNPDVDAIVGMVPDLVVMDEEENRREDHDAFIAAGLEVHVTRVRAPSDVDREMSRLAERLGTTWRPIGPVVPPPVRADAFVPIWRRPWMALGTPTYGTGMLELAGIGNVFAGSGPYPSTDLEAAASRGPDVVVAPDEPYPFSERHVAELSQVAPVVLVDGKDLFWWGARTAGAVARLREVLAGVGRRQR